MQLDAQSLAEYQALTSGGGVVLLEGWSVISLSGADRHTFLHNMCTNEIKGLSLGQGCEAFCTDVKGKIVAHVFVMLAKDKTYLVTMPDQTEKLIAHLDRFIIREDVLLADETDQCNVNVVTGNMTRGDRAGEVESMARLPLAMRGATLMLSSTPTTNPTAACGLAAWNSFRIEAGWPLYDVDFNAEHLPQEVARDAQAINFNKGCYLGQETVARLDALGHVNKHLVTVKFAAEAEPNPGVALMHKDKQVGEATSVAGSPQLGTTIGIAMVRRGANEVGTVLESEAGPVEVIPTPVVQ